MPERAQDEFETLNPGPQPISAQELRNRSNSVNNRNNLDNRMENPLVVAETNLWPSQMVAAQKRREPKISIGDFDTCYTAPDRYGYKRESSHR